ncbi:MAG: beta strand repeat-containing protein, partial [Bacteroidota bacterium]
MIKKYIFIVMMLALVSSVMAQIPQQLNYQGIARNASGEPISAHVITVRLSIIDSAANGIITYQETKMVSTNYVGLFTIVIGAPGGTSVIGTIASINWSTGKKYIKLEIDPNGATNFSLVGMNQLQSVPFALASYPVGPAAGDLVGNYPAPSIANGAVSIAKLNPLVVTTLNGKLNISDTATMLLPYVKQVALTTLLSNTVIQSDLALKENTANKSGTTTLGTSDVLFPTQNAVKTYVDAASSSINLAINNVNNTSDVNKPISALTQTALDLKENTVNKSVTTTLGTSDILFPTQNAVKTYVDVAVAGVSITDGSITDAKIISLAASKLTGVVAIANGGTGASTITAAKTNLALNNVDNTTDMSKPISLLTQVALDLKENTANKSVTTALGISDILFPTQNAVKTYVDAAVAGVSITDGSITDAKIISISAGKLTGVVAIANGGTGASTITAAKTNLALNNVDNTTDMSKPISLLTQVALDLKENTANKSAITTLGASDVLFPTQNAVKTYVDAAIVTTAIADASITDAKIISVSAGKLTGVIAIANGGTGASTITAAKTNLALNNVDNTSDINKPISTLTQTALDLKENTANKSVTTSLGTSDVLFPTQNAVKTYVDAAVATTAIADGSITDAKIISVGASKLTGIIAIANGGTGANTIAAAKTNFALNNVDNTSDVNKPISTLAQAALDLKENTANKSVTTTLGTSDVLFPTQNAVKTYVDAAVAGVSITDGSITDAKIISVAASKLTGVVPVAKGGTGSATLSSGYVKAGVSQFTTTSTIPVNDVVGAIKKVNGTSPDANGDLVLTLSLTYTGVYNSGNFSATVPTPANSNIYIVSSDPTPSNNGRTFIYDGAVWREITANQASTDARYLRLDGGTLVGDLTIDATKKITLTDLPTSSTDAANKSYVDAAVAGATIADGSITNAKIVTMEASKLTGLVAIANGGTGASTIAAAKTNLLLNNVDNTNDLNKPISTLTQSALDIKENTANKSINTALGTSDVLFPSQKAVKNYVDAAVAATTIADASITDAKIISLSGGKLTGVVAIANGGTGASTAAAAKINLALNNVDNTSDVNKHISSLTQTALNAKENAANKSINTTLGTSDVLFPTQNAVKTYVDAAIATTVIADGSITNAKIISLAATKLTGVLPVANGGTGASTAAAAKINLALNNVDNTSDVNKPISSLTQTA